MESIPNKITELRKQWKHHLIRMEDKGKLEKFMKPEMAIISNPLSEEEDYQNGYYRYG